MFVRACCLYDNEGRPLPRHRLAMRQPLREGWLTVKQGNDLVSRRITRLASLRDELGDVFAELVDVGQVDVENGTMMVPGQTRDPLTGKMTAQAWYCEVVDGRHEGPDSRGPLPR